MTVDENGLGLTGDAAIEEDKKSEEESSDDEYDCQVSTFTFLKFIC